MRYSSCSLRVALLGCFDYSFVAAFSGFISLDLITFARTPPWAAVSWKGTKMDLRMKLVFTCWLAW